MEHVFKKNSDVSTTFDALDYSVFASMLIVSIGIGIFFGCFGNRQKSANDYLLAARNIGAFPVAFSLIASSISAISLIGIPSEVYTEDPTLWLNNFGLFFGSVIAYYFFIPSLYELDVNTAYEYLELRFNKSVRSIASWFYCISYLIYLPAIIYVPSLTLSLVTGVNLHIITIGITIVCVFYTTIGGLKAVVWTDLVQIIISLLAFITITVIGTVNAGGFSYIMKTAYYDGKLNIFNMDPDPLIRSSFWTMFGGGLFNHLSTLCMAQGNIQRYLSLKSRESLPLVLGIYSIGSFILYTLFTYGGLLLYTVYYGCDPVKHEIISKYDQIFPYYILDKIDVPALPGLFVAGVFGAALSSLSTGLNTIAGIVYEDYLKSRMREKIAHIAMQLTVVLIGIFSIASIFLIETMGRILYVSYTITSIVFVPIFVLFSLGMLIPSCNVKGAFAGVLSSTIFLAWIGIGSTISNVNNITQNIYPEDTCHIANQTKIIAETFEKTDDYIFPLYKLSYMLYTFYGLIVGVIFGIITSYVTGPTDSSSLDPRLISPPLRRFLPKKVSHDNSIALSEMK